METCQKPQGNVISVVSPQSPFRGNPYVVSTRLPHMETVNPMIPHRFPASETWEHLTSGFHEFPHLVNPVIPPRFFALQILGKPYRRFPLVSTQVYCQLEDSTQIPCMENIWKRTFLLGFFTRFHDVFKPSISK